jgi:hypothetical protein
MESHDEGEEGIAFREPGAASHGLCGALRAGDAAEHTAGKFSQRDAVAHAYSIRHAAADADSHSISNRKCGANDGNVHDAPDCHANTTAVAHADPHADLAASD